MWWLRRKERGAHFDITKHFITSWFFYHVYPIICLHVSHNTLHQAGIQKYQTPADHALQGVDVSDLLSVQENLPHVQVPDTRNPLHDGAYAASLG